jgi:hypothetical protein
MARFTAYYVTTPHALPQSREIQNGSDTLWNLYLRKWSHGIIQQKRSTGLLTCRVGAEDRKTQHQPRRGRRCHNTSIKLIMGHQQKQQLKQELETIQIQEQINCESSCWSNTISLGGTQGCNPIFRRSRWWRITKGGSRDKNRSCRKDMLLQLGGLLSLTTSISRTCVRSMIFSIFQMKCRYLSRALRYALEKISSDMVAVLQRCSGRC